MFLINVRFLDFKPLKSDKSFLAIKAVHTHLDDDSDGTIDAGESQEVSKGNSTGFVVYMFCLGLNYQTLCVFYVYFV